MITYGIGKNAMKAQFSPFLESSSTSQSLLSFFNWLRSKVLICVPGLNVLDGKKKSASNSDVIKLSKYVLRFVFDSSFCSVSAEITRQPLGCTHCVEEDQA